MLALSCLFFLAGCGNSDDATFPENPANSTETQSSAAVRLALGSKKWTMSLPKTWEKVSPFPKKGVLFLAREGTQNIVITHERGFSPNLLDTLFETTKNSLDTIEKISQTDDSLIFRGKLSATTPMREFYQKVLIGPNSEKFLLISCSQEVSKLDKLDCPDILASISPEEAEK